MRSGAEDPEPVLAEVAEPPAPTSGAVAAETSTCPPWPYRGDPRRAVHVHAHVALLGDETASPYASPCAARWGLQRGPEPSFRGRQRTRRRRERDEEGVALRVDLDAVPLWCGRGSGAGGRRASSA